MVYSVMVTSQQTDAKREVLADTSSNLTLLDIYYYFYKNYCSY